VTVPNPGQIKVGQSNTPILVIGDGVTRSGNAIIDKTLISEMTWPSAIAIPYRTAVCYAWRAKAALSWLKAERIT